jgi:bifunctional isochorismate lyase/aryl carrier protein
MTSDADAGDGKAADGRSASAAFPAAEAYRLGAVAAPTHNRVAWTPDLGCAALLLHDVQPHYLAGLGPATRADLLENLRVISRLCAARGAPIFASRVPPARTPRDRGLMLDMWGEGPAAGATQTLAPELELNEEDVRPVLKRSYSAFYGNDFEVMLRRLGCTSLIVTGVYASAGCLLTSADAFMRDIRVFFIADAVADFRRAEHEEALRLVARTSGRVIATGELLAAARA